jgi:lysophospholipase L1-like esterase
MQRSRFCSAVAVLSVLLAPRLGDSQTNAVRPNAAQVQAQLAKDEKILQDWADLSRYRHDNSLVPSPGSTENRVVFMGDSITDAWGRSRGVFFPGKPYINRGISGQTTPQMLIRFRPDVIALQPKAVLILAGTNDIAGNTGPESIEETEANLQSMAELARVNGIKVVLSSVMPVCDYIKPQTEKRPPEKIVTLNAWIRSYCASNHLTYLDYYSALIDDHRMFRKELTYDGLHPNDAGYAVMAPLAAQAIAAALAGDIQ